MFSLKEKIDLILANVITRNTHKGSVNRVRLETSQAILQAVEEAVEQAWPKTRKGCAAHPVGDSLCINDSWKKCQMAASYNTGVQVYYLGLKMILK